MKKSTKIRAIGAAVIFLNIILVGAFNITGSTVLVITFGIALAIELVFVRPAAKAENNKTK